MELFFNTINKSKQNEIKELFDPFDCEIKFLEFDITEILSHDIHEVILAKSLSAFSHHQVPIIVEHGALSIEYFNSFPGALSKPMWDLMGDKICELIPEGKTRAAKVISAVCYCNGKKRYPFFAETNGHITTCSKGAGGFQFDPIFIPESSDQTYAEMSQTEKLQYSQATKAYKQLQDYLKLVRKK